MDRDSTPVHVKERSTRGSQGGGPLHRGPGGGWHLLRRRHGRVLGDDTEERARVHEVVVSAAARTGSDDGPYRASRLLEAAQLSHHAEQIGADFVIAINPYFPIKPGEDIVRDWYRRLTSESSVPFFLFNTSYSGYALSPR